MNYHNLTYPDMNNGSGMRVVLWLSGCSHHCKGCQNPQTWDINSGIPFDEEAKEELFRELSKDYISGITFTGGDPLHENNLNEVLQLIEEIKSNFPNKTIWLYTGYIIKVFEVYNSDHVEISVSPKSNNNCDLLRAKIVSNCNVVVDGRYECNKRDISLHWKGSSNQRVIDVQKSLEQGHTVILSGKWERKMGSGDIYE